MYKLFYLVTIIVLILTHYENLLQTYDILQKMWQLSEYVLIDIRVGLD